MTAINQPQDFGLPTDEEKRRWSEQAVEGGRAEVERLLERGYDITAPDPVLVTDMVRPPTTEAQRLQALDRLIQALPCLPSRDHMAVVDLVHCADTIARYIALGELPALDEREAAS